MATKIFSRDVVVASANQEDVGHIDIPYLGVRQAIKEFLRDMFRDFHLRPSKATNLWSMKERL